MMTIKYELIELISEIKKLNNNLSQIILPNNENNITQKLTYTVNEFCKKINISKSHFYNIIREKKDFIKIIKVGRRSLITHDEAERWIKKITK